MTREIDTLAATILDALDHGRPLATISGSDPGFDLPEATAVSAAVTRARQRRGETMIGRKIGFTNVRLWDEYGVRAPIWGPVWDTTSFAHATEFKLGSLVEPKIEPEIMFQLARAPKTGMSGAALQGCIGGIAFGFEIVQSLFAGWRFHAADTVACGALHGALLPSPFAVPQPLPEFEVILRRDGTEMDRGHSSNVMETGPLAALAHLVELLATEGSPPLRAGEIVSTGSLTRALPVAPGETWSAQLVGLDLPAVSVTFR